MPLWLIKTLIGMAFLPALLVGVCLLFLLITYFQVVEEAEEDECAK